MEWREVSTKKKRRCNFKDAESSSRRKTSYSWATSMPAYSARLGVTIHAQSVREGRHDNCELSVEKLSVDERR